MVGRDYQDILDCQDIQVQERQVGQDIQDRAHRGGPAFREPVVGRAIAEPQAIDISLQVLPALLWALVLNL